MIKNKRINKYTNIDNIGSINSEKQVKGFTLIELLIVMAIIAVLTGLSLFSLQSARKQGRDGKRKSDLETIRSAIELFKADCNVYPSSLPTTNLQGTLSLGCSPANTNIYYKARPSDPTTSQSYYYSRPTTTTYYIWTALEDPGTIPSYCPAAPYPSCGTGVSCNYCVTNP